MLHFRERACEQSADSGDYQILVLDPHSAVGASVQRDPSFGLCCICLTSRSQLPILRNSQGLSVELVWKHEIGFNFEEVLPPEFIGLSQKEKRVTTVENSWQKVRERSSRNKLEEELKPKAVVDVNHSASIMHLVFKLALFLSLLTFHKGT